MNWLSVPAFHSLTRHIPDVDYWIVTWETPKVSDSWPRYLWISEGCDTWTSQWYRSNSKCRIRNTAGSYSSASLQSIRPPTGWCVSSTSKNKLCLQKANVDGGFMWGLQFGVWGLGSGIRGFGVGSLYSCGCDSVHNLHEMPSLHKVEYGPCIKSQPAPRNQSQGLTWCKSGHVTPPKHKPNKHHEAHSVEPDSIDDRHVTYQSGDQIRLLRWISALTVFLERRIRVQGSELRVEG